MVYLAPMFIDASGHASSDPTDVVKFRMVRTLEFAMKTRHLVVSRLWLVRQYENNISADQSDE